jgi:serine phosphatase RsbU (regulator of sigma subunit)
VLAARLAEVAEGEEGPDIETLKSFFAPLLAQAAAAPDAPLIDEFWLLRADGRAHVFTASYDFAYPAGAAIVPGEARFRALLETEGAPLAEVLQVGEPGNGAVRIYAGARTASSKSVVIASISRDRLLGAHEAQPLQTVIENFVKDDEIERIVVLQRDGTVLASTDYDLPVGAVANELRLTSLIRELLSPTKEGPAVDEFSNAIGVATEMKGLAGATPAILFIQFRTEGFFSIIIDTAKHILWTGAVLIIAGMIISFWMARRFAKPLVKLTKAVEVFGKGRLDQRIDVRGDREITALADSFNQMAGSIQAYMRTLRQETRVREQFESEFRIAAELQRGLLPENPPEMPELEVAGMSVAAREVGGDFYDYVRMGAGRLGVAIGDATGNGLSAALLISECWSVLRALAGDDIAADHLLYRTNNAVCQRVGDTGRFATLFFAIIDTQTGRLRFAVAGHNPPFVLGADGRVKHHLRSDVGLPLGVSQECQYQEASIMLDPGDTLVLYSDGVTEANNAAGQLYGDTRLHACTGACVTQGPTGMVSAVLDDLRQYTQRSDAEDDMTLVVIRYHGPIAKPAAMPLAPPLRP